MDIDRSMTFPGPEMAKINSRLGTIPDPTELLMASRSERTHLPPPRSRSPIKTYLGSSPRRSVGRLSTPSRITNSFTPVRGSMPSNFSIEASSSISETSNQKGRSSELKRVKRTVTSGNLRRTKRPFDLNPPDDDEDDEDDDNNEIGSSPMDTTGKINHRSGDDSGHFDVEDHQSGKQPPELEPMEGQQFTELDEAQEELVPGPAGPTNFTSTGKKRSTPLSKASNVGSDEPRSLISEPRSVQDRLPARSRAETRSDLASKNREVSVQPMEIDEAEIEPARPNRRGRKRADPSQESKSEMKPPPRPREKRAGAKTPAANAGQAGSHSRSLYISRSETPAEDSGARVTRAGRTSVKPIAFWRGERIVYGDASLDGSILTLPAIKEVIRTDEIAAPRPKRPTGRRYRARPRSEGGQEEEDDYDAREPWEQETGIMRAQVMQWDPMTGRYDEDNTEETGMSRQRRKDDARGTLTVISEVAYAAEAMRMRDISGSEFRFAKTLTLPFFGSVMVDVPPLGAKRVKNSRKMQLVFFVFEGRVTVDMGTPTASFSIGKGGMWQVPRGKTDFFRITSSSALCLCWPFSFPLFFFIFFSICI